MNRRVKRRVNYPAFIFLLVDLLVIIGAIVMISSRDKKESSGQVIAQTTQQTTITEPTDPATEPPVTVSYAQRTDRTLTFGTEITCAHGILIDVDGNEMLAERGASDLIYPASMTKIMTLVVAVESDLPMDTQFTMTAEIIDPLVEASASMAGFLPGEIVSFQDLLYGAMLPSGADATTAIAQLVGGTEDGFANMMNEKAAEIGMESSHFMNASGLHNVRHYSTVADIALLLEYAIQNDICKEVLSTYQYTTAATTQAPEGHLLESTMFSRMYGNEVSGVQILGGKTGFTDEAGNCLASFAERDGKTYIAVLSNAESKWRPIFETFQLYAAYIDPLDVAEITTTEGIVTE